MAVFNSIFLQLAIVLGLSSLLGVVMKLFKLPIIIAYLLAGVILSSLQLFDISTSAALSNLPDIGIALALFFVGMELDLTEIKSLGRPIIVAGLSQIIIATLFGFSIAGLFGFREVESIFLGIGLSISSTIVVVKMLLERKDLTSLYGKLALGITLLEDLFSILILMVLSVGSSFLHIGLQQNAPIIALVMKGAILFLLAWVLTVYILPRVFKSIASFQELLFLVALAWCFIFVTISLMLGFSVVVGAFLAGIALANSPFHYEIQGKVKPLRDFFVALFFVYLGSRIIFSELTQVLPLILIFTSYALVLKPLVLLLILGAFGFKKHTIFQTAISLSQISEFSLIIIILGLKLGLVSQASLTALALTGVLSIILSSTIIANSKYIYQLLMPLLTFFEHKGLTHQAENHGLSIEIGDHVVLIGAHRMGGNIAEFLKREKIPLLVLDFNPRIIQSLATGGINAFYGDVGDPEVLELLKLPLAKLIISTATDNSDNLMLLSEVKKRRISAAVVVRASSLADARVLYKAGADYVILPEIIAGEYLLQELKSHWPKVDFLKDRSQLELDKLSRNHLAAS